MKLISLRALALTVSAALALGCAGCAAAQQEPGADAAALLDPKDPTVFTIWTYHNGDQLEAFEALVTEFNQTVGAEQGIAVRSVSQSSINNLADCLLASAAGEVGAQELPTLASVYAETAYILEEQDMLVDMDQYFTPEELAEYQPGFVAEGRFDAEERLLLFPACKSTEVFAVNTTDWAAFEAACGIAPEQITTQEELASAAEQYYLWTDSLTPELPEDGKALYGRDSLGNYIYLGCAQLGHPLFQAENGVVTPNLDRDTFKTLWDSYYVPYINGYYGAYAAYRSEDAKLGRILALTGSSTGVGYLPDLVTPPDDDVSHEIEMALLAPLPFAGQVNDLVVQQGASFCMLRSTPAQQAAAACFLKWFTESERNADFAAATGYSPVKLEANDPQQVEQAYQRAGGALNQKVLSALTVSAELFSSHGTYTCKPFAGSKEIRDFLEGSLQDIADRDRTAVVERIAAGMSRQEATADFCTDAYFDAWFQSIADGVAARMH